MNDNEKAATDLLLVRLTVLRANPDAPHQQQAAMEQLNSSSLPNVVGGQSGMSQDTAFQTLFVGIEKGFDGIGNRLDGMHARLLEVETKLVDDIVKVPQSVVDGMSINYGHLLQENARLHSSPTMAVSLISEQLKREAKIRRHI